TMRGEGRAPLRSRAIQPQPDDDAGLGVPRLQGRDEPRGGVGQSSTSLTDMRDVPIRDESIRLGQFLKLAGLIDTGADAKSVIGDGLVTVNGDIETRRGRQLRPGDVVSL